MTGRYKILVLEDEILIAMELAERLSDLGYEVIGPAHTLEQALEQTAGQRPDAALLDANVNGQSSIDFGADLAARGVPVAFCTGYDAIKNAPPALASAPILTKPFNDAALAAALKRLVG